MTPARPRDPFEDPFDEELRRRARRLRHARVKARCYLGDGEPAEPPGICGIDLCARHKANLAAVLRGEKYAPPTRRVMPAPQPKQFGRPRRPAGAEVPGDHRIVRALTGSKPLTLVAIRRASGLSASTVRNAVARLLGRGVISRELGPRSGHPGPRAYCYRLYSSLGRREVPGGGA